MVDSPVAFETCQSKEVCFRRSQNHWRRRVKDSPSFQRERYPNGTVRLSLASSSGPSNGLGCNKLIFIRIYKEKEGAILKAVLVVCTCELIVCWINTCLLSQQYQIQIVHPTSCMKSLRVGPHLLIQDGVASILQILIQNLRKQSFFALCYLSVNHLLQVLSLLVDVAPSKKNWLMLVQKVQTIHPHHCFQQSKKSKCRKVVKWRVECSYRPFVVASLQSTKCVIQSACFFFVCQFASRRMNSPFCWYRLCEQKLIGRNGLETKACLPQLYPSLVT